MTNNKSECCRKCEPQWMHDGHSHSDEWIMHQPTACENKSCPCHLGDSLRKQEEKQCDGCKAGLPLQGKGGYHTKNDRVVMVCQKERYTPKVATSEKGIYPPLPTEDYVMEQVTPPESEDWEIEFDKRFLTDFCVLKPENQTGNEKLHVMVGSQITTSDIKNFIREERERISSKAYQRGREEGFEQGKNYGK